MSIMFVKIRSVSRGTGGSAVAKAAYIARERLRDERTGTLYDYRATPGLEHAEILVPAGADPESATWTRDRASLWNAAEAAETRANARVGREYTVSLPHELPSEQRGALAREFAQSLANRYSTVVDLAVHGPTLRGDPRNYHAHILTTTRELTPDGLGRKTAIELNNTTRYERGLPRIDEEFRILRTEWAERANEKLRDAGLEARLEPRSRAELARAAHREAILQSVTASTAHPQRQFEQVVHPATTNSATATAGLERPQEARPSTVPERSRFPDETRERAARNWLAYTSAKEAGIQRAPVRENVRERGLDAGLDGFD